MGLNWRALIAPECLVVLDINASLSIHQSIEHYPSSIVVYDEPRATDQLVSIPQIQRSIFQATGDHSAGVIFGFCPRKVVKAIKVMQSESCCLCMNDQ